jgi:hypothetical protein
MPGIDYLTKNYQILVLYGTTKITIVVSKLFSFSIGDIFLEP